jgi:release factor glutamine methyltransferase
MRLDRGIIIKECEGVYPPREDSHLLLDCLDVRKGERVLEMGCGSGIISLHCAKAGALVTAVDINPKAVSCTKMNAQSNRLEVEVLLSDLLLDVQGSFDTLVFNPPYLPSEEKGEIEASWAGGEDGVRVLERFLREAPSHMNRGGNVVVLLSSLMRDASLSCVLSSFRRRRLGQSKLFFEELWVEELTLPA